MHASELQGLEAFRHTKGAVSSRHLGSIDDITAEVMFTGKT
jgi:hypothetical protein